TGLWHDYVILSGLAAGVVTFVLTALIVDRVVARSTHERRAAVTRLAISDMLHAVADENEARSRMARSCRDSSTRFSTTSQRPCWRRSLRFGRTSSSSASASLLRCPNGRRSDGAH